MPNELVQINNTLNSSATDEALTAAQGKILNDKKVTGSVGNTTPTSSNFIENEAVYFQYNSNNSNVLIQQILNAVYPVGSYYWSSNSTDPGSLFGGTWTPVTDKFILAAGSTYTAGDTGGAESVTSGGTALTTNQIPAHTHGSKSLTGWFDIRMYGSSVFISNTTSGIISAASSAGNNAAAVNSNNGSSVKMQRVTINATHEHTSVGGGAAHSHTVSTMPPYEVAYCWKRTA